MRKRKKLARAEWTKPVAEWRGDNLGRRAFALRSQIEPAAPLWWVSRLLRGEGVREPAIDRLRGREVLRPAQSGIGL